MSSTITESFVLLALGLCVIAIRTYARFTKVGIKNFKADDYLMLLAAVIYSLETATSYIVGAWWLGLANNGMTDEERKALDPNSHEAYLRRSGSKTQLIGWSLYTLLLWTLKLCITIFYSRLTTGIHHLELRVTVAYGLIASTYIATEASILFGCSKFHKNWQIYPDPGNHCQPAVSKVDLYVTLILNVLTDFYLLTIPLPVSNISARSTISADIEKMLWQAKLSLKTKLSLLFVLSGGVFVMMAGILRVVIILHDPLRGAQKAGSWAVRETFVAVVVGNLPMIYPLIRLGCEKAGIFSRSHSTNYNQGYQEHTNVENNKYRKKSTNKTNNSMPTFLRDDSQEYIVSEGSKSHAKHGTGIQVTTDIELSSIEMKTSSHQGV
ncbi:hypothetical protein BP6252_10250 [Coleophoma cylindrospora]|uniref:Rhodopsin domain-containing protein n=1 Tax=Coleophoma cylindrospora TaxID=1849047 RepID=A0A3D8QS08_9HELO|nr:hypothetical protein BP6252_10250 [Coleophoma cylindrospora]